MWNNYNNFKRCCFVHILSFLSFYFKQSNELIFFYLILISWSVILYFVLFFLLVVSIPFVLAGFELRFSHLGVDSWMLFLIAHPFSFPYTNVFLLNITNLFTVPVFSIMTPKPPPCPNLLLFNINVVTEEKLLVFKCPGLYAVLTVS